jgi:hypothetical protein
MKEGVKKKDGGWEIIDNNIRAIEEDVQSLLKAIAPVLKGLDGVASKRARGQIKTGLGASEKDLAEVAGELRRVERKITEERKDAIAAIRAEMENEDWEAANANFGVWTEAKGDLVMRTEEGVGRAKALLGRVCLTEDALAAMQKEKKWTGGRLGVGERDRISSWMRATLKASRQVRLRR